MGCFLYILKCSDGSYYTGTYRGEDIETRLSKHNHGQYVFAYTAKRLPVKLVFVEDFANITDAIAAERQVKGWTRVKKEALIDRRWDDLPELASRPKRR